MYNSPHVLFREAYSLLISLHEEVTRMINETEKGKEERRQLSKFRSSVNRMIDSMIRNELA